VLLSNRNNELSFFPKMLVPLLHSVSIPCKADTHSVSYFHRYLTAFCLCPSIHLLKRQLKCKAKYLAFLSQVVLEPLCH
jgi:hypothetical protein